MDAAVARGRAVLEREAELSDIEAAVAHACASRGTLVVVEGQAGIGKSALVAAGRDAAATAGARVLRARGGELEQGAQATVRLPAPRYLRRPCG